MMFRPVAIGILWAIICATFAEEGVKADSNVCEAQECKEFVEQIKKQMGSTNPCNDFYTYVCGQWEGSKELISKKLKEKAVKDLMMLLDAAPEPTAQTFNATEKLVAAYKSCTHKEDEQKLEEAVKTVLTSYGLEDWPVLNENNAPGNNYTHILQRTGPRPLFDYFVSNEASSPIITMTKPNEFFVSAWNASDYGTSVFSRSDDREEVTDMYSNYDDYDDKAEEAYKKFITETMKLLNNTLKEDAITTMAKDVIDFEKKLYSFASEASANKTRMNLSKFIEELEDNVPMVTILNKDLKSINFSVHNATEVEVQYLSYYKKVVEYTKKLQKTDAMTNYIGWVLVRGMAAAKGTRIHKFYLEYKNATSISWIPEEDKDNKIPCLRQLLQHDLMYTAGAYYYSKAKFDNESKNEVLKIMQHINTTFHYITQENKWMSSDIKAKVLQRLGEMTLVIGYPGWLMNNDTINKLYQFVPKLEVGNSYAKHYYYLRENDRNQKLLKLTSTYINKTYEEVTLKSHSYYDEATDTLAYPAAAIATHFKKPPIPRAANFATIGTILAQLLTSAMDKYDKKYRNGSITKTLFWDNSTTSSFCKNSQCLNNSEQCSGLDDCYSGRYETLEDYVGLRASHMALTQSKSAYKAPMVLSDQKLNTEDKIFLILFGNLYCPHSRNEKQPSEDEGTAASIVQERADYTQVPFRESLNEIVSIYKVFNKTFNCNGTVSDVCHLVPEEKTSVAAC